MPEPRNACFVEYSSTDNGIWRIFKRVLTVLEYVLFLDDKAISLKRETEGKTAAIFLIVYLQKCGLS